MLEEDHVALDDHDQSSVVPQPATRLTLDLTGIQAQIDRIEQQLAGLAEASNTAPGASALAEALASLEKQISRAGREQFKASTLAEAQRDQIQEVLAALRTAETAREQAVDELRDQATLTAKQARLSVARAIIPALDGLDEALRSGRHLATAPAPPAETQRSWFRRKQPQTPPDEALRADLRAWLDGLEFVRDRLLAVLGAEGITPIPAVGQAFDPEIHMAVEVSQPRPDAPPGTVAALIRQGYMVGEQVLRPAEVAVVKAGGEGEAG